MIGVVNFPQSIMEQYRSRLRPVEAPLPPLPRENKILDLFRRTRAYARMSPKKRVETLIAAHFWADGDDKGFWQ